MIYFEGTDDQLWRIDPDGSGGINLGGYRTKSTPVAFGDSVYFRGTDDKLWKINLDGTGGVHLGGYKTHSRPMVTVDSVYFQGTDDKLWKINLDGTGGVHLGGYKTSSAPVAAGGYVYFQGTDDKLWRIHTDGTGGINLGLFATSSPPFVTGSHVYFQGTDDKLWRTMLNGSGGVNLGGYRTSSTPFVTDQYVYFRGTDDKLWRIGLDGTGGVNLGGYRAKSAPTVDTEQNLVYFQGTDDKLWRIDVDGSGAVHLGGYATKTTPFVVQPANQPQTGSGVARYTVLTLVYAPPGTTGGPSTSSVDYGSGSALGTTASTSESFKSDFSVGVALTSKLVGLDFGLSQADTDTNAMEIKKSASLDLTFNGPQADGINHDEDVFYLWLNPQVTVTVDPEDRLDWQLGLSGPTMTIQAVRVGWLKHPASMPRGVRSQLAAAGLTEADYAEILALDPFAGGDQAIDPDRFVPTTFSFPYAPPLLAGDEVPTLKYVQTNSLAYAMSHEAKVEYTVGITGEGKIWDLTLKGAGQLQWANSATSASANSATQSATVAVGGPAFGYTGPTDVLVYWDVVYGTYLFAFAAEAPRVSSVATDNRGTPLRYQPISLTFDSQTFTTFTNGRGEFRFYRTPTGPLRTSVPSPETGADGRSHHCP